MSANDFRFALSWSRLSDYLQCPRKFKFKYIDKLTNFTAQSDSPHLIRGSNVHKALENYLISVNEGKNPGESSLPEVEQTKPLIQSFRQNFTSVVPEQQISIDKDWKQVEWFSKQSYYRAIFDLIALAPTAVVIGDYKTGKFKDYSADEPGQLELSAAIALNMWSHIPQVDTMYIYVDHKKTIKRSFTQKDDKERLTNHFIKIHQVVNAEQNWDPKKNQFCHFCEATKLQCQYATKL